MKNPLVKLLLLWFFVYFKTNFQKQIYVKKKKGKLILVALLIE